MSGLEKVKEKMDTILLQTHPHRILFMEMMNEIPISSKEPKGSKELFLQDAERNAAHFASLKPGYFMYIGPGSENTWYF